MTTRVVANESERRGRRWLMWSFIFCPCHLPVTMTVLGAVLGGTAFGALITRNTITVGVGFGILYAVGLAIGFRHLRTARRSSTTCSLQPTSALFSNDPLRQDEVE